MGIRSIIFRGKRIDDGEWVEGLYVRRGSKDNYIFTNKLLRFGCNLAYEDYRVIPETVGQYTGMDDRNGRKIFEGDIVEYSGTHHQVVFEKRCGNAYFGIVMSEIETWGFSNVAPANRMEVLGNIHDNPNLCRIEHDSLCETETYKAGDEQ